MLRKYCWLVGSLPIALGLYFTLVGPLNRWANQSAKDWLNKSCSSCEVSLGAARWSWRDLVLTDVSGRVGESNGPNLLFHIQQLKIRPKLLRLLLGHLEIERIKVVAPRLVYADLEKTGTERSAPKSRADPVVTWPTVVIDHGEFKYIRDVKGTHAVIEFHNLKGEVAEINQALRGSVTGRLGERGDFEINLVATPQDQLAQVDVELRLKNLSLVELSDFFEPNAGVKLMGDMQAGHALLKLRQSHLDVSLWAEFSNFDLHVLSMYDRTRIEAAVTNLGTSIAMRAKNLNENDPEKRQSVGLDRQAHESVVSFMLRGLKEASLKVVRRI